LCADLVGDKKSCQCLCVGFSAASPGVRFD
jgi:hypothetical protein